MKISRPRAAKASSTITPMLFASSSFQARPSTAAPVRGRRGWLGAAILGLLAACSSTQLPPTAPPTAPPALPSIETPPASAPVQLRERSRWVQASWSELPGWNEDSTLAAWPALLRSCSKPAPGWTQVCARALAANPHDEIELRAWLREHLQPWRVESLEGQTEGLVTGYFEPLLQATRRPQGAFRIPLHGVPPDLAQRKPFYTRAQIEGDAAVKARLRPLELAYVDDALEALVLHIQGSGRVQMREPDGQSRLLRLAFAGHNDQPYQSIGRYLIDKGELRPGEASWPQIRDWARRNPARMNELLWANPRYVFFREEALPDPELGPKGAQGVPLTPGRSIAVDKASIPYGTPVWLDATEPLSSTPLRRLVVAQDTGSAIVGAVRADFFWGWGAEAEAQAGRMKQPLKMWVLWPRG